MHNNRHTVLSLQMAVVATVLVLQNLVGADGSNVIRIARETCEDANVTGFFVIGADGQADMSQGLSCYELGLRSICDDTLHGEQVREMCPQTCEVPASECSVLSAVSSNNNNTAGNTGRNAGLIVVIVFLALLLAVIVVFYVRAGRTGGLDLYELSKDIDASTTNSRIRRGSQLYSAESDSMQLEPMSRIGDHDVAFVESHPQSRLAETSLTAPPIDFAALAEAKEAYVTESKLRKLRIAFDQFTSVVRDNEDFDLNDTDAVERIIHECFDDAQLSHLLEYSDLLESLDVEDFNSDNWVSPLSSRRTSKEDGPTSQQQSPSSPRPRLDSTTSLDTRVKVHDFIDRVVESLKHENKFSPDRKQFWPEFMEKMTSYIEELKSNDNRIEMWDETRRVGYDILLNKFFDAEYLESRPQIDDLKLNLSHILSFDAETLHRSETVNTKESHTRWKLSSFWTHVRLMLDQQGDSRVQMKSFLVYVTEECLDFFSALRIEDDQDDLPDLPGAVSDYRRPNVPPHMRTLRRSDEDRTGDDDEDSGRIQRARPSLSLEGFANENEAESNADMHEEPVFEEVPETELTPKAQARRSVARNRSIAPLPGDEADPKHPPRVHVITGKRPESVNEKARVERLAEASTRYIMKLHQATIESPTGLLPDNAADIYIPEVFSDMQQGFRIKITDLEDNLAFLRGPGDQGMLSIWTAWAWSSFWVQVKLELDDQGDGRVMVRDFYEVLTGKIRDAHRLAATKPNGQFSRTLARGGSIVYLPTAVKKEPGRAAELPQERRLEALYTQSSKQRASPVLKGKGRKSPLSPAKKPSKTATKTSDNVVMVTNSLYDNIDHVDAVATGQKAGAASAADAADAEGVYDDAPTLARSTSSASIGSTLSAASFREHTVMQSRALPGSNNDEEDDYGQPQDSLIRAQRNGQRGGDIEYATPQDAAVVIAKSTVGKNIGEYTEARDDSMPSASDDGYDTVRRGTMQSSSETAYAEAVDGDTLYASVHVGAGGSAGDKGGMNDGAAGTVTVLGTDENVLYTDVDTLATLELNRTTPFEDQVSGELET